MTTITYQKTRSDFPQGIEEMNSRCTGLDYSKPPSTTSARETRYGSYGPRGGFKPREFRYGNSPKRQWKPKPVNFAPPKPGEQIQTNHKTFACGSPVAKPEQEIPIEDKYLVIIHEWEKAVKVRYEFNDCIYDGVFPRSQIRTSERTGPTGVIKIVEAMPKWLAAKAFPAGCGLVKQEFQLL